MANDTAQAAWPGGLSANAFSSLFQAVNGLRNRRAIVALLGCTFAGVLVAGLVIASGLGMFTAFLAMLIYAVAIGTGVNAAGLLQMDEALGHPPRRLADALVAGLMCIPKLIVLALAFLAVEVAVFIVIALLLLVCKIPFLGALLFVAVFPLSVVAAGITIFGIFLCGVFSLPAIWQGASITQALTQTLAIARTRLIEAILLLVFVAFLCFAVGLIVFGVLGFGLIPTVGMSAAIVGIGGMGDMGSVMALAQGGGGGRAIAGMIGGVLLWAVAGSLVGQVYLRGLSLVYLRVTEGLDLSGTEEALRARLDEARRRASEFGETTRGGAGAAGSAAAAGSVAAGAAAFGAVPPAYNPAPVYNPPPAYSPPPEASFEAMQSAAFGATPPPSPMPPPTVPAHDHAAHENEHEPDISLPFDDVEATQPTPMGAAPPAWSPPPGVPTAAPAAAPVEPAPPAMTACPQCLSPVTPEDVFCGVCGYRLK